MKSEILLILLLFYILLNNNKDKETFNNEKYFNLKKRIEPSKSKTLPPSKLFDQREFIKPNSTKLWYSFFGNDKTSKIKDYDRIFLTN